MVCKYDKSIINITRSEFRLSYVNYGRELAFNRSINSILYEKAKKFTKIDCNLKKLNSWWRLLDILNNCAELFIQYKSQTFVCMIASKT